MSRFMAGVTRHKTTASYAWHLELVEQCRPYRATHRVVLVAVGTYMRGKGAHWYTTPRNRRLATETLRKFGVAVTL